MRDRRSRNRKRPEYNRLFNFRINQDLDERLWKMAEREDRSISDLIREFCYQGLAAKESNLRSAVR